MGLCSHVVLLASYNQWMNAKLYTAAHRLAPQDLALNRGAFFGSILGTLNHIVVGDTIWLKRFAAHPTGFLALEPIRKLPYPERLDQILIADLAELTRRRKFLDQVISNWAQSLVEDDLSHVLHYTNSRGAVGRKLFASLVFQFFNHQTHHRGQATTLLHQAGQDIGITDRLALIPQLAD